MFHPSLSLQDQFAPHNACFGCGPSNEKGLQIKTFIENNKGVATWISAEHHEAFPGMLNGGIIGALLDCHSNWTAAFHLMQQARAKTPPCTVTAFFNVTLRRPTPSQTSIQLTAECVQLTQDSALIHAQLLHDNTVCAICEGKFVAVKEGHPAFHRW